MILQDEVARIRFGRKIYAVLKHDKHVFYICRIYASGRFEMLEDPEPSLGECLGAIAALACDQYDEYVTEAQSKQKR